MCTYEQGIPGILAENAFKNVFITSLLRINLCDSLSLSVVFIKITVGSLFRTRITISPVGSPPSRAPFQLASLLSYRRPCNSRDHARPNYWAPFNGRENPALQLNVRLLSGLKNSHRHYHNSIRFADVDGQYNKNVFHNCELTLNTVLQTELTRDKNRIFVFLFCLGLQLLYL